MRKLVQSSIVALILTMSASAQIQKSPNNRVFVDEDYEYTESVRRTRNVNEQMLKGLKFHKARDFTAAANAFSAAANLDPSLFEAQYNLGITRIDLRDFNNAAAALQKAVRLDRLSWKAWHYLGFALFNAQHNDEAMKSFLRALEIDAHAAATWSNLGQVYLETDKLDDAEAAFTKALENDSKLKEPVNGLCVTFARAKKSEQAVSYCTKARSLKPTMSITYYLAWSYLDLKKFPEAITTLKDCERLDPNKPAIYMSLAEAHYFMKRYKEALSYAQKAVQMNPNSDQTYLGVGHIYFGMKKPKQAKTFFEKALTLDPKSASARYNLAMTCLALNQRDCAQEQYAILKHVKPDLSDQLFDYMYSSKVLRLVK